MFSSVDYEKLRALRITHVATRFEDLIKDESNDDLTPEQLFLTAVDDALDARRAHRIERLTRQAGSPIAHASIAELDYSEGRGINQVRMRRYATHDSKSDATNVRITSPTGGGKTYLACAIGIAACQREHHVTYARMDDLARTLVIARGDGIAHQDLLNNLSHTDLLIIDDFLTIGIDPTAASDLFAILANREHRRPTIVASQSAPDYWAQTLPDRIAADSIVNRLANNSRKINLGTHDMRKHHNQAARQKPDYWEEPTPTKPQPHRPQTITSCGRNQQPRTALPTRRTATTKKAYLPASSRPTSIAPCSKSLKDRLRVLQSAIGETRPAQDSAKTLHAHPNQGPPHTTSADSRTQP